MDVSQSGLLQLSAFYGDRQYDDGTQRITYQPNPASSAATTSFIATASGSGMFGFGLLLGLAALSLDTYLESSAFNIHLNAFRELFSGSQQQMVYQLGIETQDLTSGEFVSTPFGAQQPASFSNIHPAIVSTHLSQTQSLQELNEMRMENELLIIRLKQENIEANKKLVNLLAENRKRFESLETKSQDSPRRFPIELDTSFLPFELEFFEYKKDEFKIYKFRRTGELPSTALKTVWLPQDYSLSEVKDYIRIHYNRIHGSDQYLDFNLIYDGTILQEGKTVNNKVIDDDIIFSTIGFESSITIMPTQAGSSGQLRSSRQGYDDVVRLDLFYLNQDEVEIREFYSKTVSHYLKGSSGILINELSAAAYRNLYYKIQEIKTSMTIDIYGFDTQDTFFLTDFKNILKARWDTIFKHDLDNQFSSFTGDKKTQAILTYEHYIDNLYRDIFKGILEKVSRIDTADSVKQAFKEKFEEAIQMTILDTILRDKLSIDDHSLSNYDKFNTELDEFMQNADEMNNLDYFFHSASGINKVLDLFIANFLTNPLATSLSGNLQSDKKYQTYSGFIKEQIFLTTRLRPIIINTLKDIFSGLSADEIKDIRGSIRHYSSVSFDPADENYDNIFDLDYTKDKFFKAKKTGRFFDGGGIYDLINIGLSIEIKSTTFESLVEADKIIPRHGLVDGLSKDSVSAMIIDMIKRILDPTKETSLSRSVRLVFPYAVDNAILQNPFSSSTTIANLERMLTSFFTQTPLKMGAKLASHEVFLVRLVNLLDNEFQRNILYAGQSFTMEADLKNAITSLLQDPQFQKKVTEIAFISNLKFYKADSFSQLSTFLTETNFEKIVIRLPDGQFRLRLVIDYNPHFKTSSTLQLSDFPTDKIYTLDMTELSKLRQISSDAEMMSLLNEDIGDGLVAGYHPSYPDSIVLIPSNKLKELKYTFIQIGYKYQGVTYYSFVCDNDGDKLISKLDFTSGGITIREGSAWVRNFYEYNPIFENGAMIGFESNFYAAYTFATGDDVKAVLQDTTVILEHDDPFKDPLHQYIPPKDSKKAKISPKAYIVPLFKDVDVLIPEVKNELIEVLSFIDQYINVRMGSTVHNSVPIANLFISQNFYDKDFNIINSLLNDLNPTLDQLSDLSYSRQKLFYSTLHEIFKGYSGTNNKINDYNRLHDYVTFEFYLKDTEGNYVLDTEGKYIPTGDSYYNDEFKAIKDIEKLLPELFGYKLVAALKMGSLSFIKDNGRVTIQPIVFSKNHFIHILNARKIKSISTANNKDYTENKMDFFTNVLTSYIVFGHQTTFDIISGSPQTLYMYGSDSFLSSLTSNVFYKPITPTLFTINYGKLTNTFLKKYENLLLPEFATRKNIYGKTALMNGYGKLFQARFSPTIVSNIGRQSGLQIFQDRAHIISKSSFNYALLNTFNNLIYPTTDYGPTTVFRSVFNGKKDSFSFFIRPSSRVVEDWSSLWIGDHGRAQNFGIITLNYPTIVHYFWNDFSTIRPALHYTRLFSLLDLNVQELLTSEFKDKINHLNNKFYESISTKYNDGDKLTVTFHQDTSNGIYYNSDEDNSLLSNVIPDAIQKKFPDLFSGNANSLSITIQKQGNEILNEDELNIFIDSLTFYLVMFNSIALIQESNGQIGMIASQRELHNIDYIFQLDGFELSPIGAQILATYQAGWNVNNEGHIVWNYGDCWPINLFTDARELINLMNWEISKLKYEPWEMNIIYPS